MTQQEANKTIIQNSIETVWNQQNLAALPDYWNANCIKNAMPSEHWSVADMAGLMQQLKT